MVHGDDYVSSGSPEALDWLEVQLKAAYEIQTQRLGMEVGWDRQGKVLNRIVSCDNSGWHMEADPRHAELIIEQLGADIGRAVATPGVDGANEEDEEEDTDIVGSDATRFRGLAACCNYLSFDRPDIQFSVKEMCREMSKPTTGSLRRLQRVGRYLKGRKRLVWDFAIQDHCDTLDVYTDSDWAGCRKSRKSTSGGAVMMGSHCLKVWSKTQAVVAKSSAEAELYAVVRGVTEALGMSTLANDLGLEVRIQMHLDAMAAKGILERQGISKVRHLDVNILWMQEQCARKILPLAKVPGEDNPADLMTKNLTSSVIDKNMKRLRLRLEEGRAEKAAQLHALSWKASTSISEEWQRARDTANDQRGGDRWGSRGSEGTWHRIHKTPRRALFTPFRVSKGPSQGQALNSIRFTRGITESGTSFEFLDDWTKESHSHRLMEDKWM